jgi:hypothetical protein
MLVRHWKKRTSDWVSDQVELFKILDREFEKHSSQRRIMPKKKAKSTPRKKQIAGGKYTKTGGKYKPGKPKKPST